jgi:hypothetical protein
VKSSKAERRILRLQLDVMFNLNLTAEERLFALAVVATTALAGDKEINVDALCAALGIDIERMRPLLADFVEQGHAIVTLR